MSTSAKGRPVSANRSAKVAEKLRQKIREGEYYEAHQTYRALYQRYNAQGREKEAVGLLSDGAKLLLEHTQWESGTDLALLLVTHLKGKMTPVSEDLLDMIGDLFTLYKCPASEQLPSSSTEVGLSVTGNREMFMRAALKWSSMVGGEEWKYGHPHLHKLMALSYWNEKDFARAREHFIYARQPEDYGAMLVEFASSKGYPSEADLFLTQAVLQLLVMRDRRSAMAVFTVYTQRHAAFRRETPPFGDAPLLNFVWFLLLASEKGDGQVLLFLREQYEQAIARDSCYDEYLDKISQVFFHQPVPSAAPAGGLLGLLQQTIGNSGFLGSLLGGPPPEARDSRTNTTPHQHIAPVEAID